MMCWLVVPAWAGEAIHVGGKGPAVVLVLGPEADEGLYVWPEGGGLAPYLVRHGFSVWIAQHGDLAADLEQICRDDGVERAALVGFGLGGTAIYRYLADRGDAALTSIVTVGAPAGWQTRSPLQDAVIDELARPQVARVSSLVFVPSPLPLAGDDLFGAAMTNVAQEREGELLAAGREAGATERDAVLDDLDRWVTGPPAVGIPALVTCGELDRWAPCEEAWRARDAMGDTAIFRKFGYMNWDGMDFGHLDLALTPEARKAVFPVVAKFLKTGEL